MSPRKRAAEIEPNLFPRVFSFSCHRDIGKLADPDDEVEIEPTVGYENHGSSQNWWKTARQNANTFFFVSFSYVSAKHGDGSLVAAEFIRRCLHVQGIKPNSEPRH